MKAIRPYSYDPANFLDFMQTLLRSIGPVDYQSIEFRRQPETVADLAIFMADPTWAANSYGQALLDHLLAAPEFASIRWKRNRISIRLSDEWVDDLGTRLQRGEPVGLYTADLLNGAEFIVDFCDPNATKALHVGHLRNIAIGHSIASILTAAGGRVLRQSVVCDVGRNVFEAMAGYLSQYGSEELPLAGMKPDMFVGQCYTRYVRGLNEARFNVYAPDEPIVRELQTRDDLAQSLLQLWMAGDPATRNVWQKLRSWVLEGQQQTLHRLGTTIERCLYESETFELIENITSEGLRREILQRSVEGSVVYCTGKPDYPFVPLLRTDGFPTEHMRGAAVWYRLQQEVRQLDGCIHVMGEEWLQATLQRRAMLAQFLSCPVYHVYHEIPHGMVYLQGSTMKSSTGDVILIDELLDSLLHTEEISRMAEVSSQAQLTLARIIVLGFFAGRRHRKAVEVAQNDFTDERKNPGWLLAMAWSRAQRASCSQTYGTADNSAARFATIQSQSFRRLLYEAATTYDMSTLVRYLIQISKWYLGTQEQPALERIMCTLLRTALLSLGFLSGDAQSDLTSTAP